MFRSHGIRFRICSGTGILVALGLSLAGFAVVELASISRQVAALVARSDGHARILEVERLLEVTGRSALGYRLSGDAIILKQGSDAEAQAEGLLKQAFESSSTETERGALAAVISGIEDFRRMRNVLVIMTDELGDMRRDLADGGDVLIDRMARLVKVAAATGDPTLTANAWGADQAILLARSDAWRFFAGPDAQRQAACTASIQAAIGAINHLQDAELSDEQQELATPVGAGIASYATGFDQLSVQILKQQDLFDHELQPKMDHLLGLVREATAAQQRHLNDIKQATDALIANTIVIQKAAAGLALIVGGLIALIVSRGITRPIAGMTGAMTRLAAGDTTVNIPSRLARNEIGAMAKAVEVFRQNAIARVDLEAAQQEQRQRATEDRRLALSNMAEAIEREAGLALANVDRRTTAIEATADEMAASAERTGDAAQGAATAANEALAKAQTVASAAEHLAVSVQEIDCQVQQSTVVVGRALEASRKTRTTIEALNERVAHIGSVADMICQIAGRTNLLALNATIEAARAGMAGKGFAVVASEVKQLAVQTARSTEEISRQIGEVRAATSASVEAVGQIERTVDEVNAIAGSIAAAIVEQGAATAEIARNVAESAMAANDMARQVTDVSGEAERTTQRALGLHGDMSELHAVVSELNRAVIRVVRTSTAEVDRRHHSRCLVDLPCQVNAAGHGSHAARLVDLSEGGACVRGCRPLPLGCGGTLQVKGLNVALQFTVRTAEEDALHLAFELDGNAETALRALLAAVPQVQAA